MDKMTHVKFNLNNFLLSISGAIDNAIKQNKFDTPYSSQRVSYIALNIGIFNGLTELELADLLSHILLSKQNIGAEDLRVFPFSDKSVLEKKEVLEIIYLSNIIEDNLNIEDKYVTNKDHVLELVENLDDIDESIKENLFFLSEKDSFWFDLTNDYRLPFLILDMIGDATLEISYVDLIHISKIIYQIANHYSGKNYHEPMMDNLNKLCHLYKFDEKDTARMLLSGYLSGIGVLRIPQSILQKCEPLSSNEINIMRAIPYYTKQILSMIFGFDDIVKLASSVYEKNDGSGYPYKLEGNDLAFKNRVLSVIFTVKELEDIKFNGIYSDQGEISEKLEAIASDGKLDISIVKDFTLLLK